MRNAAGAARSALAGSAATNATKRAADVDAKPAPASMSEALASVTHEPVPVAARAVQERASPSSIPPSSRGRRELTAMLEDIDGSFEAILSTSIPSESRPPEATGGTVEDLTEVRALFKQIAGAYVGPVRDLMIELKLGEPPKEWVHVCRPAVSSLRGSAERMGLNELVPTLEGFLSALDEVERTEGPLIGHSGGSLLTEAYVPLVEIMPEAFALKEERNRREPIIVLSLLKQVPEVRKVALDRIYAAGLTTLEMFYVARPDDLAEATGLDLQICRRIVAQFQSYKHDVSRMTPDAQRSREHAQLKQLADQLAQQNIAYDRRSGWRDSKTDKRQIRRERSETILQINVVLARLGNVDLVNELEKLAFHKKVERLERFLADNATGITS
jgi:hypothetical protein